MAAHLHHPSLHPRQLFRRIYSHSVYPYGKRTGQFVNQRSDLPLSSKPNVITHVIMRSTVGIHEGPYKNRDTCLYMHVDA
ncbi:predicted protein [Botrytis cinerea T4]|uniref:Uncharacterized protein n=1 Tax=Botryotinia fuckeliana (strain T4) TaxID=999810 RepID=G2XXK6_BOTF4|nr:predicted protein [Botrytis cinerea T4]